MHKLFQPDPARIEPRTHPPTHDRAPDEIARGALLGYAMTWWRCWGKTKSTLGLST